MADVTITAANVKAGANAKTRRGIAGATIAAGQVVYETVIGGVPKVLLADCNASITTASAVGIALNNAANDQPIEYVIEDDDFTVGGTLSLSAAGARGIYVLSGTPGGIAPQGDLASGDYPVVLGVAKSTTKMVLRIVRGITVLGT